MKDKIKSQNKLILEHLEKGKTITQFEAIQKWACLRLAARINNLKERGHKIETEMIYSNGVRFGKYKLIQSS